MTSQSATAVMKTRRRPGERLWRRWSWRQKSLGPGAAWTAELGWNADGQVLATKLSDQTSREVAEPDDIVIDLLTAGQPQWRAGASKEWSTVP